MARLEDTEKRHNTHMVRTTRVCMSIPYAYGTENRTVRVWYIPYAYGTKYAYGIEHKYCYQCSGGSRIFKRGFLKVGVAK